MNKYTIQTIHIYSQLLFQKIYSRWYSQVLSSTLGGEIPLMLVTLW